MGRLEGKVALITGAARGIGATAARLFAQEGAKLMLADLRPEPLQELTSELQDRAVAQSADVADEAAMHKLVQDTVARYGRIDIALLNAGISGEVTPIVEYPAELFDKVVAVNVRGVWLGLKYVMQAMEATGGSIVITSSTAGIRAVPNMSPYIASKHAAIGLMRAAAMEGASKRIRVNTVNPATINTPMVRELYNQIYHDPAEMSRSVPLSREGTAEEVARLMLFLASDEASFCTGGVYMVDGGVSAGRAQ